MRFSVEMQSFYPDDTVYNDLPDDLIGITNNDHSTYLNAITAGSYIYSVGDVLTISPPRPDQYYEWDSVSNTWTISEAGERQRKDDVIAAATQKKASLRATADDGIAWRQDAVDAGIATDTEVAELAEWKKYRVLLMREDTSKAPEIDWPPQPA